MGDARSRAGPSTAVDRRRRGNRRGCSALARAGLLLVLLQGAACEEVTVSGGKPLDITLTVNRTTGRAAADSFVFDYEAQGGDLLRVVLDFGDGARDSLSAQGSVSASARRAHLYQEAGTYRPWARVEEVGGGRKADTVTVEAVP